MEPQGRLLRVPDVGTLPAFTKKGRPVGGVKFEKNGNSNRFSKLDVDGNDEGSAEALARSITGGDPEPAPEDEDAVVLLEPDTNPSSSSSSPRSPLGEESPRARDSVVLGPAPEKESVDTKPSSSSSSPRSPRGEETARAGDSAVLKPARRGLGAWALAAAVLVVAGVIVSGLGLYSPAPPASIEVDAECTMAANAEKA